MPEPTLGMVRVRYMIVFLSISLVSPCMSVAEDDIRGELRRCSLIDDSSARLDCYDALSGRNLPAPGAPSEPPSEETLEKETPDKVAVEKKIPGEVAVDKTTRDEVAANNKTLDDIGSETLPKGAREEVEKLEVRAKVSRCEKDFRKKYRFYFDNGQIWTQTSDKRLYFKDCNFEVTITQDFFGYKMRADGEKRQIRISRVK